MSRFMKPALALGLISAVALAMATPSEARSGRNAAAAIGAGVAGFAVGAAVGSAAAANSGYYHHQPYGYYDGYAYAPARTYGYYEPGYEGYAYVPPRATRYDRRDPSSYYVPGGAYGPHSYSGWDNRERSLRGGDW